MESKRNNGSVPPFVCFVKNTGWMSLTGKLSSYNVKSRPVNDK